MWVIWQNDTHQLKKQSSKVHLQIFARLEIEHLIYFKGSSHSLSNQHTAHLQSISALTLLTTCFNSMLKSLTLFLFGFFLCPLFPPLLLSPPPLHPSHYSRSLPLFCASACKVGIGKIPKHLRNLVALCLSVSVWKNDSFRFYPQNFIRKKKIQSKAKTLTWIIG